MGFENDAWYKIVNEIFSKADIKINGPRPWDIRVRNRDFFKRILNEGSVGLGESYMDGWWECDNLDELFYRIVKHRVHKLVPGRWSDVFRVLAARLFNLQSKIRARRVCDVHYNLGNDLFAQMLDPHMQYSCGYWDGATTLEEAQKNKLRMICEKLRLEPGMRLLDIGCGWGGLTEYAARHYDVTVLGVSNSSEQVALARGRCTGLNVEILLSDYRDLDPDQRFDRVVSVGMFEHVGPKNYDLFFSIVDRCLAPDGIFLLYTIGSNTTVTKGNDWTEKYIFPGGCIPSVQQIGAASEPYFVMEDWHNFGPDYDVTLMAWHARFSEAWPKLSRSYDERFKRMFEYYLMSCAGAFRARHIQLWQVLFSRGLDGGLSFLRRSC
ncbi:cyclopropane-fatty-acyl-phospholipid synthase-like [Bemisia tabaci]|uniref:cyclopropane-fatty-acyl-phospholipid synthase-like n=1 Tax=Bemisia tabaci TaxID=7038 RepID=UPI003B27D7A7